MHCEEPGCLEACPRRGAIVQYANGIVDVNPDQCIGCGSARRAARSTSRGSAQKTGRWPSARSASTASAVGLEPACVKACPTGCLHFGTKADMLALGNERVSSSRPTVSPAQACTIRRASGARASSPCSSTPTSPRCTDSPQDPTVPKSVRFAEELPAAAGAAAASGAVVVGLVGHYLSFGPRRATQGDPPPPTPPAV